MSEKIRVIAAGAVIGLAAVLLTGWGNPQNMGFCIACFLRDGAGAMKLHSAPIVQYFRPEIVGIVLGSFAISVITGDFRPRSGSSPVLRFFIGFAVMVGALAFLGCPLRMVLRLAGGDLNALIALLGFIAGIGAGCIFLANGFSLGRAKAESGLEGAAFPGAVTFLFVLFLAFPALFAFSESGPGSMHAPVAASLAMGLAAGIAAERSRLCMAGGIRDIFLIRDFTLLAGFVAIFAAALAGNLVTGRFSLGFADQPVAHSMHLWNFLGMFVVGLGSAMLGGCPLRQLILAGEGNGDSVMAVLGMTAGAAFAHNFSLAASAGTGPGPNGKAAVIISAVMLLAIAAIKTFRREE